MRELGDSENEDEIEEQLDKADPCLVAFAVGRAAARPSALSCFEAEADPRQFTRVTCTRLSEKVGARPSPQKASEEIEFTDPSERLRLRQ